MVAAREAQLHRLTGGGVEGPSRDEFIRGVIKITGTSREPSTEKIGVPSVTPPVCHESPITRAREWVLRSSAYIRGLAGTTRPLVTSKMKPRVATVEVHVLADNVDGTALVPQTEPDRFRHAT